MSLICMARLLWQGVNGRLYCAGSAAGAVRAQSLDGDGGSGEGPLLGANITCRQDTFSCHVHSCRTPYQDAPVSDVPCRQLMTTFLRHFMASHDVGIIDYRGKQLTLIGGPLLDPFSASFQGEHMLPGAQVMQKALCSKTHLAAIAGCVSHGFSSVPVLQHLRIPDLLQDSQDYMHA